MHSSLLSLIIACTATPITPTAINPTAPPANTSRATLEPGILATPLSTAQLQQAVPALAERAQRIEVALKANPPVVLMIDPLDDAAKASPSSGRCQPADAKRNARPVEQRLPVRAEIMGVYPTRESDYTDATQSCKQSQSCYRVEIYNYAFNYSMVAIVDVSAKSVLAVNRIADSQPDIPPSLTKLATEIAVNSPEVDQRWVTSPTSPPASCPTAKPRSAKAAANARAICVSRPHSSKARPRCGPS